MVTLDSSKECESKLDVHILICGNPSMKLIDVRKGLMYYITVSIYIRRWCLNND